MDAPGRTCPLAFRYRPEDLAGPAAFETDTLYVVGGLYGNDYALEAIRRRAAAETTPPEIVFNGDFHYLDADPIVFQTIATGVTGHRATLGNVEYALGPGAAPTGCGCDYPAYVSDDVVANSNAVVHRLRATAANMPEHTAWLAALPRYLTARVGRHQVGIVHGDPESVAGWKLALEAIEPADETARIHTNWSGTPTSPETVIDWCRRGRVEILCCSHTGLPYAQDYLHDRHHYLVANNGSAGLPNFTDRLHGVITRLSTQATRPADSLYGLRMGGLRFDALPVYYDHTQWINEFERTWPARSPAHHGYHSRITSGTWLPLNQAARAKVRF